MIPQPRALHAYIYFYTIFVGQQRAHGKALSLLPIYLSYFLSPSFVIIFSFNQRISLGISPLCISMETIGTILDTKQGRFRCANIFVPSVEVIAHFSVSIA